MKKLIVALVLLGSVASAKPSEIDKWTYHEPAHHEFSMSLDAKSMRQAVNRTLDKAVEVVHAKEKFLNIIHMETSNEDGRWTVTVLFRED